MDKLRAPGYYCTMTEKLGIIFLHHNCNDVTINNLKSIRKHNPEAIVNTISSNEPLPDGYSLKDTPDIEKLHTATQLRGSDWLVCSWFRQRRESCDKWWIVEWDTFCEISVHDYYKPVWNHPFVASSVQLPYRETNWWWFQKVDDLPQTYKPYAIGAVPFLYLMSEHVLELICRMLLESPFTAGNGELRFTTAANKCGFPPCGYSPPNDRITWIEWHKLIGDKAIFHPVKHIVDYRT